MNYLSSHVLLVYNEQRQQQIIKTYYEMTKQLPRREHMDLDLDHTLPNKSCKLSNFIDHTLPKISCELINFTDHALIV